MSNEELRREIKGHLAITRDEAYFGGHLEPDKYLTIDQRVEAIGELLKSEIDSVRRKTVEEILQYLEVVFKEGHGGGNWRRLIDFAKANIKAKYQLKESDEA